MNELVELYNPANAKNLTEDELALMQGLDNAQINELAEAYPNQARGNNYLVIYDNNVAPEKQLFSSITWKNLASLRNMGKSNFVPFTFSELFKTGKNKSVPVNKVSAKPAVKLDLSDKEISEAEGVKQKAEGESLANTSTVEAPVLKGEEKTTLAPEIKPVSSVPATTEEKPKVEPAVKAEAKTEKEPTVAELEAKVKDLRIKKATPEEIAAVELQITELKKAK